MSASAVPDARYGCFDVCPTQIRPLAIDDYSKGHLQLLSVLTETPDRGQQAYEDQFKLLQSIANTYYIVALTSKDDPSKVIGSGSVIVERKFIRGHASLAHIEDIVVSKDIQGKGLGKKLLQSLILLSKRLGCYKTLLDCSDENRGACYQASLRVFVYHA